MLVFHILISLVSIAFTTYLFFFPSQTKLYVAESMVLLTVTSGVYLAFSKNTNLLQVCMTGLVYIAVISFGLLSARNKLATSLAK